MEMSSRARVLGFGAALLLPAACSGPFDSHTPPGIEFHVAGTLFGPGDTIRVNLSNNTEHALSYNLCTKDLERRVDGSWLVVQTFSQDIVVVCYSRLYHLPPGESTFGVQIVYPFLDSGIYRFRDQVEWSLNDGRVEVIRKRVDVISNAFSIAQE